MSLSPAEAALVGSIRLEPMLANVLDWSSVNSGTDNLQGLATLAERLFDAFSVLPGEVQLVAPEPVERIAGDGRVQAVPHGRHLVLRVRPWAERRVLLTGHMDTVYGASHTFQQCSWIDDQTLHGPGTADMKGGIALMLAGLMAFEAGKPVLGYDVLINSDEETGSLSSARLIADLAKGKYAALTYEPALPTGQMARARPGSGNFSAIIRGRSAHAGRNPQDGRNAVVAAGDLALRLADAASEGLSINPARIDGGGPNNVVPDNAVLRFNMRPASPDHMARGQALIARLAEAVAVAHEVDVELHGGFGRPPKPVSAGTQALFEIVAGAADDLGQEIGWADTGGVCDGNNIAACGVPVIDTMGALGGKIHSPEEFLLVNSLVPRAQLTALVLARLETGEILP